MCWEVTWVFLYQKHTCCRGRCDGTSVLIFLRRIVLDRSWHLGHDVLFILISK